MALVSYYKTKKNSNQTVKGLFFANQKNSFWIVGGALLLSNISPNQLIGENESIFINNMSVIAWGVSSVLAMLVVAEFLLPIYFKTGSLTIPDFLGKRYGSDTKRLVSIIVLISYLVNLLPSVLYGGAVAFTGMFSFFDSYELTYWQQIWIMVWIIGTIGAIYSILGGMRAIAISDSVLSIGLLLVGLSFPFFGFMYLGDGDWHLGFEQVITTKTHKLNAIGGVMDEVPFGTIFTGMFIMNLYYWGMEQYIVQQAMTAKSLSHSQKGMALACFGKLLCPFLINIPGIIAVHMYTDLENTSTVFPKVVNDVLPPLMVGLTAAIVLGAAVTTFNAGLKSSSTLFVLNIYKPNLESKGKVVSEKQQIRKSKVFEIIVSLSAMIGAPFIIFSNTGFYTYLQQLSGMFCIPIFSIILMGFVSKKISAKAAKFGLIFFIATYIFTNYIISTPIHYLHLLGILFVLTSLGMLVISNLYPNTLKPIFFENNNRVDVWNNRYWVMFFLLLCSVFIFILFSPFGLAS